MKRWVLLFDDNEEPSVLDEQDIFPEFFDVNDFTDEEIKTILRMEVGDVLDFGGGAQSYWMIVRGPDR